MTSSRIQTGGSTGGDVTYRYSEILPKIASGWTYHCDDFSKVPYLQNANQTKLITFDDTVSVRIKTEYAIENGLAGVMVWALGQDVNGESQPLLETIGKAVRLATGISQPQNQIAGAVELFENYPNPFKPSTTIRFYLQKPMPLKLTVYDINGHLVAVLKNSTGNRGMHSVTWKASAMASGIDFYKLQAGDFVSTKRMLLLR